MLLRVLVADQAELGELEERVLELERKGERGGEGEEGKKVVWRLLREGENEGRLSWENEMEMLASLESMLEAKLDGLKVDFSKDEDVEGGVVREGVREMCDEYRKGQKEILGAALEFVEGLMEVLEQKLEDAEILLGGGGEGEEEEE